MIFVRSKGMISTKRLPFTLFQIHLPTMTVKTMTLIKVLVSLLLITIVTAQPISYSTYDERELSREHPPFLLLVNHQVPELEV